jgi:hypothetical protein
MTKTFFLLGGLTLAMQAGIVAQAQTRAPSVADYPSIQEAIRANPGRVVYVPAGD